MDRSDRVARALLVWSVLIALELFLPARAPAGGIYLPSAGPVHRSMGGASTAAPLDAWGALYWNPATISGLEYSELEFGIDLLLADHQVASTVGPFSGVTEAHPGVFPVPSMAWVHHTSRPGVTFGLGIGGVAGFKTNLEADPANPLLAPPPLGFGRISSEAAFLQVAPTVSLALSDRLSVGFGPLITLAQVGVEPFVYNAPNADGIYPSGRASRFFWGGGAQAGVYYIHDRAWHFGASIKTPAWMEQFEFYGQDAAGAPRTLRADLDLPMIVSVGTAWSGLENWVFALDVRFYDYKNADGFGERAGFDATGALTGLDWSSVFEVAAGIERQLTEDLDVRAGYSFNQNPIRNGEAVFNLASPLIYQHLISAGATYRLSEKASLSAAWSYVPPIDRVGPIITPGGPIPGASVSTALEAHFLSFGVAARY
jgi:long-chain fatty acid transport protein